MPTRSFGGIQRLEFGRDQVAPQILAQLAHAPIDISGRNLEPFAQDGFHRRIRRVDQAGNRAVEFSGQGRRRHIDWDRGKGAQPGAAVTNQGKDQGRRVTLGGNMQDQVGWGGRIQPEARLWAFAAIFHHIIGGDFHGQGDRAHGIIALQKVNGQGGMAGLLGAYIKDKGRTVGIRQDCDFLHSLVQNRKAGRFQPGAQRQGWVQLEFSQRRAEFWALPGEAHHHRKARRGHPHPPRAGNIGIADQRLRRRRFIGHGGQVA